ncbi:MAG: LysR family transcriptional regulator [Anaerolineales bacterium]|nr:LysR family transcriptional regulator [Anaerolineales bacterium]
MRLRHIEVFHAVYTCGSITAAAKLLNVSQPSVSKVLAHAEQQLGFALFDRAKGKLIPTQEAERLINHVTDAYDNISELRRVSENLRASDTGRIRIAMTPAFGIDLVPAAIASYLEYHPDTRFEIETLHHQQVSRALKELRIDIGLVFDPPVTPGIKVDILATGRFVVLTHERMDFGAGNRLSLEDLDGMPLISLSTRSPLGKLLANRIESGKVRFKSVATVETYQMAKALVAHGVGVAIIDEVTAKSMGHKNVVAWQLDPELPFNVALLHIESEPLSIVTQRFVEHLESEIENFLQPSGNT